MSFKADSVDKVLEFEGLPVLQREGNSTEVPKFAKGDNLSRSCAIKSIAASGLRANDIMVSGRCTLYIKLGAVKRIISKKNLYTPHSI